MSDPIDFRAYLRQSYRGMGLDAAINCAATRGWRRMATHPDRPRLATMTEWNWFAFRCTWEAVVCQITQQLSEDTLLFSPIRPRTHGTLAGIEEPKIQSHLIVPKGWTCCTLTGIGEPEEEK